MPRDGAQNYSVPGGTDGVPDTPVLSTPYNGFLRDLEQDLNTPRPILAGGTGATNARDAMINLSGEMANQGPVANYADYPFLPGTFYSNAGATDAPPSGGNASEIFLGICYGQPGVSLQLECRGYNTHTKHFRSQTAGVWSAWVTQVTSQVDADAMYVNVTGDIMNGPLIMSGLAEPKSGAIGFGNTGTKYLAYDGVTANNFDLSGPLALPATPPPLANHAVRQDYMAAADAALQLLLQTNIDLKADKTAVPVAATVAEFVGNTAPTKMLTPGAAWGATLVGMAANTQINMAAGFDFQSAGGYMYQPINVKQGQKGTIWIYGAISGWAACWKFPNSIKPTHSGGYDICTYSCYSPDYIWCCYLPAMG
jgi:hypothetical protein